MDKAKKTKILYDLTIAYTEIERLRNKIKQKQIFPTLMDKIRLRFLSADLKEAIVFLEALTDL